ncbi:MAG: glycosyltransferase family 2 protein [Owenweeksia sp.]
MDLSLCIPVYNEEVSELVHTLLAQGRDLNISFEVRVYDDGSEPPYLEKNRSLKNEQEVQYHELPENLGRAAIRNLLADEATGEYLLFMDCDMGIENDAFLKNYWEQRIPGVICGGHKYSDIKPEQPYYLHWLYGRERETSSLAERQEQGYASFRSSNFFLHRDVLKNVRFKGDIKGYGHEDTFFAYELKVSQTPLKIIDNAITHKGLEKSDIFIEKTKNSLKNLLWLRRHFPRFSEEVRILQALAKMERTATVALMRGLYRTRKKTWLKKLNGPNPQLYILDLFKLGYLSKEVSRTS